MAMCEGCGSFYEPIQACRSCIGLPDNDRKAFVAALRRLGIPFDSTTDETGFTRLRIATSRLKRDLFVWTFDGAGKEIQDVDCRSQPGTNDESGDL